MKWIYCLVFLCLILSCESRSKAVSADLCAYSNDVRRAFADWFDTKKVHESLEANSSDDKALVNFHLWNDFVLSQQSDDFYLSSTYRAIDDDQGACLIRVDTLTLIATRKTGKKRTRSWIVMEAISN